MSEEKPSLFQKFPADPGGFVLTGGYITVTGEARRLQLEAAILQVLDHYGLQDVVYEYPVRYIPDYNSLDGWGYLDSVVQIRLLVPLNVNPRGKVKLEINVPPHLDWGKQVLEIVLNYVMAWAQQTSA